MNIFKELRKEHDIQRSLCDELIKTEGATDKRKLVFHKLKHELEIHADAEERFFYKPLISKDRTQDLARHGIAEHHEMDELIEKLEETEMDAASWLKTAKELKHEVEHHLKDEELEFFQVAGKVFDEDQKEELGSKYREYIEEHRIA